MKKWPRLTRGQLWQSKPSISRGAFRRHRLLGWHRFDRDVLAVAVVPRHPVMPDMMADDFLRAGPMARAHLLRNGRLRLRGLTLRRCSGSRRGGSLGEGRRAQAESGDRGERQHKLMHDVLLG